MQVKDSYMLNFFETNSSHLPKWCNNGGGNVKPPICQILGKYRMELPKYNSIKPYPHMSERCPSLPPNYLRPDKCLKWELITAHVLLYIIHTHHTLYELNVDIF